MSRITEAARGELCLIQIPGACTYDPTKTVWCHSNSLRHGKGVGHKSIDIFGAFGCSGCHDVVDRRCSPPEGMTYLEVLEYFQIGHDRSLIRLLDLGIVVVK